MSDGGEPNHLVRREAAERSRRVGPVDRLRAAGRALLLLAAFAVLTSVIATVTGLEHHMSVQVGHGRHDRDPIAATADVGDCRRTGPIAWDALGYWWECKVLVRMADGRVVLTTVDRSMVTPDDVGRPVKFVEICDKSGEDCRYGVPDNFAFFLLFAFLRILHLVAGCVLIILALISLKKAMFVAGRGRDRIARPEDRERPVKRAAPPAEGEIDIARLLKAHAPPTPSRPPWSRDVTNG